MLAFTLFAPAEFIHKQRFLTFDLPLVISVKTSFILQLLKLVPWSLSLSGW